jgi:ribonuclease P protein component
MRGAVRQTVKHTPKPSPGKFPKGSRLLKHADFQAVYQQGKKYFSGNVAVFYRDRGDQAGPRIGFTVGKLLGGAVDRNRIRRRMRAVVRARLGQMACPVDVVLHPRKSVLELEFSKLDAEIEQLFAAVQRGTAR